MNPLWLAAAVLVCTPVSDDEVRTSVTKSVTRLETSATNYTKNRICFSCHHQALPVMALVAAKDRGFTVTAEVLPHQIKFTLDTFTPKLKDIRGGSGIGGANLTAAYALLTLEWTKHTRDETTDALVEFLLKRQKDDGSWPPTTDRPPSEGSYTTSTALAMQALQHYGAPDDDTADEAMKKRLQRAHEKGLAFLRTAKLKSTEDRVFHLWGLVVGGAGEGDLLKAKKELLQQQRLDGGWGQLDHMKSDAYATGSVLMSLRLAGLSPKDEAYRRGVGYLVHTQHESGAWIVQTRSKPIQKLFDNGDPPGGPSQFISTASTGWAVLALAEVLEKK